SHSFILVQDAALKDAEALFHVAAETEIQARFVILDGVAAAENAAEGDVERHPKIEAEVRAQREAIEIAHPVAMHAARNVAGEGGVGVAVGAYDRAGFHQRENVAL